MKIYLLFSCFVLTSFLCHAQFLRKSIYQFEIGDVYVIAHYHSNSMSNPQNYRYDMYTITGRAYSSDSSEVSYSSDTQTYYPQLNSGNPAIYQTGTANFTYGDLLSNYAIGSNDPLFGISDWTVFYFQDTVGCITTYDNYGLDDCDQLSQWNFGAGIASFDSCMEYDIIEPIISDYYLIEGAGGPYGGWEQPGDPSAEYGGINLIYYEKNSVSCGDFPAFFVGLETLEMNGFSISPNPAEVDIIISSKQDFNQIRIFNLTGETIMVLENVEKGSRVAISTLSSGTYVIKGITNDGSSSTRRFIKR